MLMLNSIPLKGEDDLPGKLWYGVFKDSMPSLEELYQEFVLETVPIRIFDKVYDSPRLVDYQGEFPYRYSGHVHPAKNFSPSILAIKQKLDSLCQFEFNAVLINYYRDGLDYMGWHRDNEKEMDQRFIASVSIGAERRFRIRTYKSHLHATEVLLEHQSILVMENMQSYWEHMLPKMTKITEPRLNLTFRRMQGL
jgi:alkylated DNA repair dioxygenase AlkB